MVAAEAAAAGSPPLVARHSGLRGDRRRARGRVPARVPPPDELRERRRRRPDRQAARAARAPTGRARAHRARPGAGPSSSAGAGPKSPSGCCNPSTNVVRPWETASASTRRNSSASPASSTSRAGPHGRRRGGVRGPRPETLDADQPLRGAAGGGAGHGARRASRRRADRLRGRGPHRPLRHLRGGRRAASASAASSSTSSPTPSGSRSARPARIPWSPWQDQRIIDTPHYRRNDELLRYVVWRNNSFGLHVHVAINGPDRAVAVCNALRNFLPELLALSASSPFVENVNTGLHSARTQIFTRISRAAASRTPTRAGTASSATSASSTTPARSSEHTQLWWSVRPHLAFPTVEIRICDAQPDLGESRSLAALCYALAARIARAIDERRAAARLPAPADRGEPLARDPLRPLRRADRPRDRRRAACARAPGGAGRVGAAGGRGARLRRLPRDSRRPTLPSARSRAMRRARACRRSTPNNETRRG